jgi:hypothetical protein
MAFHGYPASKANLFIFSCRGGLDLKDQIKFVVEPESHNQVVSHGRICSQHLDKETRFIFNEFQSIKPVNGYLPTLGTIVEHTPSIIRQIEGQMVTVYFHESNVKVKFTKEEIDNFKKILESDDYPIHKYRHFLESVINPDMTEQCQYFEHSYDSVVLTLDQWRSFNDFLKSDPSTLLEYNNFPVRIQRTALSTFAESFKEGIEYIKQEIGLKHQFLSEMVKSDNSEFSKPTNIKGNLVYSINGRLWVKITLKDLQGKDRTIAQKLYGTEDYEIESAIETAKATVYGSLSPSHQVELIDGTIILNGGSNYKDTFLRKKWIITEIPKYTDRSTLRAYIDNIYNEWHQIYNTTNIKIDDNIIENINKLYISDILKSLNIIIEKFKKQLNTFLNSNDTEYIQYLCIYFYETIFPLMLNELNLYKNQLLTVHKNIVKKKYFINTYKEIIINNSFLEFIENINKMEAGHPKKVSFVEQQKTDEEYDNIIIERWSKHIFMSDIDDYNCNLIDKISLIEGSINKNNLNNFYKTPINIIVPEYIERAKRNLNNYIDIIKQKLDNLDFLDNKLLVKYYRNINEELLIIKYNISELRKLNLYINNHIINHEYFKKQSNDVTNQVKINLSSYSQQLNTYLNNFKIDYTSYQNIPFNTIKKGVFSKILSPLTKLINIFTKTPDTIEYELNDIYSCFKTDWDMIETYKTIEILINQNSTGSRI